MINWLGRLLHRPAVAVLTRLPWWSRRRARIVVLTTDGRVLLVKSWLSKQHWALPGGGIGRGETAEHAAVRELYEETGLRLDVATLRYLMTAEDRALKATLPIYAVNIGSASLGRVPALHQFEIISRQWFACDTLPPDLKKDYRRAITLALEGNS